MLGNGIFHHLAVLCHGIELNFFRILQELGNHYRIFLGNLGSHFQEVLQFFFIVAYIHCSTGKHIRRTHQYRIAYFLNEALHIFQTGKFLPSRLVDAELVEHGREFITVLCAVDRNRRSTQYRNRLTIEFHCQIVRNLTAYGYDYAARLFEVYNIEHTFKRKLVEVQTVAHIVVSRYCFGVIVNHDGFVPQLACSLDSVHRTPVELNGRPDTVSSRTQYNYRFFILIIVHIIPLYGIRHIKVVRQFRMLGSDGIDTFYSRKNTQFLTTGAYHKVFLFHITFRIQHETCNLEVGETEHFRFTQHIGRNILHLIIL